MTNERPPDNATELQRGHAPLTFEQQRLWAASHTDGGTAYNISVRVEITGPLSRLALETALRDTLAVHPSLWTRFGVEEGVPFQAAGDPGNCLELAYADFTQEGDKSALVASLRQARAPFPLDGTAPLVRAALINLSNERHMLALTFCHLVADGASIGIIFDDFLHAYAAGPGHRRHPMPHTMRSFALQQHAVESDYAQALEHWVKRLEGYEPALPLYPDAASAPPVFPGEVARLDQTMLIAAQDLAIASQAQIRAAARDLRCTAFALYIAALALVLREHGGSDCVLVAFPFANRAAEPRAKAVGFFANTLVARVDCTGRPSFRELGRRAQAEIAAALSSPLLRIEQLAARLGLVGNGKASSLWSVLVASPGVEPRQRTLGATSFCMRQLHHGIAKAPVEIVFEQDGDDVLAMLTLDARMYSGALGTRVLRQLRNTLQQALARPDESIDNLDVITEEEERLIRIVNATDLVFDAGSTIVGDIEATVARLGAHPAIAYGDRQVTYAELHERATALSRRLLALAPMREQRVAVCIDRSPELIVAALAILLAGGCYMPIDPSNPPLRIAALIEASRPAAVITTAAWRHLAESARHLIVLDDGLIDTAGAPPLCTRASGCDLAYAMHTSGSTGEPKCVLTEHVALRNRLLWMQRSFPIDHSDRVLLKTPVGFDVSMWELFWPLMTGATIVVAAPGGHRDPVYMEDLIRRHCVTVLHFVPSMLHAFLRATDVALPDVRLIFCSGEALTPNVCELFHSRFQARLHNLYGPTEAAIDVSHFPCLPGDARAALPIGRPISNTQLYVLTDRLRLTPIGARGEIYIGGIGLARGYFDREAETRARFIPDHISQRPGARLYRTGDFGRYDVDMNLEYLGRRDRQVKVNGVRIEMAEVEHALLLCPGVLQCAVVWHGGLGGLVAFVIPAAGATPETIKGELRHRLPEGMHPKRLVALAQFPTDQNGKVDMPRLAAWQPDESCDAREGAYADEDELTPTQARVAVAWRAVLKVRHVGPRSDFFHLGGNSINAITVVSLLKEQGLEASVSDLFAHRTLAEFAASLGRTHGDGLAYRPFSLLPEPLHERFRWTEDAFPAPRLVASLYMERTNAEGYRVYCTSVTVHGPLDPDAVRSNLREAVARHQVLRFVFRESGGELYCAVQPHAEVPLRLVDLSSTLQPEAALRAWLEAEQRLPFEWESGPLLRATIHALGGGRHQVTLTEPLLDGWSATLLMVQLLQPRDAAQTSPREVARLYGEYVALESAAAADAAQLAWFRARFDSSPSCVLERWPEDADALMPSPQVLQLAVSAAQSERLRQAATRAGVPLKSVLFAWHLRALKLATGQREVVTGLMSNGRPESAGGEGCIGMFLNVVPIRAELAGGVWAELARAAFALEAESVPYRRYPFAKLRSLQVVPLFDALFNFTHFAPYQALRETGVEVVATEANDQTYFPLTGQYALAIGGAVSARLEFGASSFSARQANHIRVLWELVLARMLGDWDGRYEQLDDTGADSVLKSLALDACADLPVRLETLFFERVRATPDAIALTEEGVGISYNELAQSVSTIAHTLRTAGVRPGGRVGLLLPRSSALIAGALATLAAGAAVVPLDTNLPALRLRSLVEASQVSLVLIDGAHAPLPGARTVDVRGVPAHPDAVLRSAMQGDGPAHVLFTSGSTGAPKGVETHHAQVLNRLRWMWRQFPFGTNESVAFKTPISFVDSVWELLGGVLGGARTVVVPDAQVFDPRQFLELLRRERVTRLTVIPSHLAELVRLPEMSGLDALKLLVVSGEPFPNHLARSLRKRLPNVAILNLYGSTEVAADLTWHLVTGTERGSLVPLGRPIDNCAVAVLDEHGQPLGPGVVGEICAAGACLTAGYIDDNSLNAERFQTTPTGRRFFRMHDLGRLRLDGTLEYVGRADRQVKIRGSRVDLAEVEAALMQHPAISQCVARLDSLGKLVAFVVSAQWKPNTPAELRRTLAEWLPSFMIPDAIVRLAEIPRTPSGKVDYRALPEEVSATEERAVEPATTSEDIVERICAEVLGRSNIDVTSNLFELGAHSLRVMQVLVRLEQVTGTVWSLHEVFDRPTVRQLAGLLDAKLAACTSVVERPPQ